MIVTTNQKQKTIKNPVTIEGVGIHTGQSVSLTFKPALPNTGYVFVRIDMEGAPSVKADVSNVIETERGTVLREGEADIHTTEHVLAALVGMDLDNVIIEIDSKEPPVMDGSSRKFIEILEKSGIQEQEKYRQEFVIKEPIHYTTDEGNSMSLVPAEKYRLTTVVDFSSKILGTQTARLDNISDFKKEIANARTFSFLHELEMLLDKQLIKGGDLSNAVIYVDKEVSKETLENLRKKLNLKTQNIDITKDKTLNNVELHYPNEAARHKLLDVIGDLALVGYKIRGEVIAVKPGHTTNIELAKKVKEQVKLFKEPVPDVNVNTVPVKDINEVKKRLPHRSPFLLVDKILELSKTRVVGLKGVTMNEPFFQGHFPSEPVMPGVLIIEALAQAGGILILEQMPGDDYITYLLKIDNVKFKHKVVPGDMLFLEGELLSPIRRGICHMDFKAYVNNRVVAEAEILAQVVKEK